MPLISRVKNFFREVFTQAKKVDWPSRQDTLRYTAIVIGISVALAFFLGLLDFIFFKLLQTVI